MENKKWLADIDYKDLEVETDLHYKWVKFDVSLLPNGQIHMTNYAYKKEWGYTISNNYKVNDIFDLISLDQIIKELSTLNVDDLLEKKQAIFSS